MSKKNENTQNTNANVTVTLTPAQIEALKVILGNVAVENAVVQAITDDVETEPKAVKDVTKDLKSLIKPNRSLYNKGNLVKGASIYALCKEVVSHIDGAKSIKGYIEDIKPAFDALNGINDSMEWEQMEDFCMAVGHGIRLGLFKELQGYYPVFEGVLYNYVDEEGKTHLCGFYDLITNKMHKGTWKKRVATQSYYLGIKVTPCEEVKALTKGFHMTATTNNNAQTV